jgi:putative ABC transport system ATP-binding protein
MIRTHGLVARHRGGPALHFPDLEVPQGGLLLLRGASGAGKSTLLALLCGLLRPAEGRVSVAGADLDRLGPAALDAWRAAHLGVVPQRLHLSPSLDVAANLALPAWSAGRAPDTARIQALLQRLGLAALAQRRPAALSVGQAQRVALARALVGRPRLLLADEPTASLDDANAAEVLALLREHAGEAGATLVVATHDARAVAALAGSLAAGGVSVTLAEGSPASGTDGQGAP